VEENKCNFNRFTATRHWLEPEDVRGTFSQIETLPSMATDKTVIRSTAYNTWTRRKHTNQH